MVVAVQNVDLFSVFSDTSKYLLEPPKEELVQTVSLFPFVSFLNLVSFFRQLIYMLF